MVVNTSALIALEYVDTKNLDAVASLRFQNQPWVATRSITPFVGWSYVSYRLSPLAHYCACAPGKMDFEVVVSLWQIAKSTIWSRVIEQIMSQIP